MSWLKLGLAGVGVGAIHFWHLKTESKKLDVYIRPLKTSLDGIGVIAEFEVQVNNNSSENFVLTQPTVELLHNEMKIGSSQNSTKEQEFKSGTLTPFKEPVKIRLAFLDLFFLGIKVLREFKAGNRTLSFQSNVSTNSKMFWGLISIENSFPGKVNLSLKGADNGNV
jgi:hypothetical protein